MTRYEGPEVQVSAAPDGEPKAAPTTYVISAEGRRQAVILLLGVATLWVAALWIALTILLDGVGGVEWVSLALMLGIIVVAPLVGWALVEELTARISIGAQGIRYRAAGGIDITCSREELRGFGSRRERGRVARFFTGSAYVHDDGQGRGRHAHTDDGPSPEAGSAIDSTYPLQDEQGTLLLQTTVDPAAQITNPLVRFLHRLACGAAIPLYGGLEGRDELVKEIAARLESANPETQGA